MSDNRYYVNLRPPVFPQVDAGFGVGPSGACINRPSHGRICDGYYWSTIVSRTGLVDELPAFPGVGRNMVACRGRPVLSPIHNGVPVNPL